MSLPTLYPAQVGSPYTTLAAPYTSGEGTMTLVDATKLPTAPNIVCLAGDVAGEFSYTGKEGNVLQGVTALPGTPVATTWPTGTFAFRGISAYDLNAIHENMVRTATYVVAASDAPAHVKKQADYVCDGTDDQVEIQAALDALPTGGGIVHLTTGNYTLDVTGSFYVGQSSYSLKIEGDGRHLIGSPGATLKLKDGIDIGGTDVENDILVAVWIAACTNARISGITFDCNRTQITAGQMVAMFHRELSENVEIDRNIIKNHNKWALWGDNGPSHWTIHHNVVYGPWSGFAIHNSDGGNHIISNNIVGLGSYCSTGIFVDSVAGVIIRDNVIVRPNAYGISLYDTVDHVQIVGNQIQGAAGVAAVKGIKILSKGDEASSCNYNQISGNVLTTNVTALSIGVYIEDAYVRNSDIYDNVFDGPDTPIVDQGTGTKIRHNRGYVTENKGAAASTADGGTIAHGCAAAPTTATVSGSVAGEIVTVTSIDATNITVAIKKSDGSAGTSQTVYWRAEV
ncbi:NosD domain-containing protein [Methanoculleus sp. UBA312]|uniref:NosD domain-containing protein n=1 Tax=Methanoculleus sp. UBA312 TaxID=1915499 RepID=UPI0031BA9455